MCNVLKQSLLSKIVRRLGHKEQNRTRFESQRAKSYAVWVAKSEIVRGLGRKELVSPVITIGELNARTLSRRVITERLKGLKA